ncbi:MAG: hypothetical protein AAF098_07745 [Pseudomonadota bacterium]
MRQANYDKWVPSETVKRLLDQLRAKGVDESQLRSTIKNTCEITWQSAHSWFTGRTRIPRADLLAKLAAAYDLDLVFILLGVNSEPCAVGDTDETANPHSATDTCAA